MSVLQVLHYPDDRLRKIAEPVKIVNEDVQNTVHSMLETMYSEDGIGLAATQVGIEKRIIVIDLFKNREDRLVLINPELLEKNGEIQTEEGCLSIPFYQIPVLRATNVKIRALNLAGQSFELEAQNLLAICIQHEMDHLSGRLLVDYVSPLKRERIRKKLEKIAKFNIQT